MIFFKLVFGERQIHSQASTDPTDLGWPRYWLKSNHTGHGDVTPEHMVTADATTHSLRLLCGLTEWRHTDLYHPLTQMTSNDHCSDRCTDHCTDHCLTTAQLCNHWAMASGVWWNDWLVYALKAKIGRLSPSVQTELSCLPLSSWTETGCCRVSMARKSVHSLTIWRQLCVCVSMSCDGLVHRWCVCDSV